MSRLLFRKESTSFLHEIRETPNFTYVTRVVKYVKLSPKSTAYVKKVRVFKKYANLLKNTYLTTLMSPGFGQAIT
jgi:hypothetical protein